MNEFSELVAKLESNARRIEEEKAKSDALFANIGDGAIATDQDGKIVQINEVGLRLLGFASSDVIGVWYPKVIKAQSSTRKNLSPIEMPITRSLLSGEPVSERVFYQRADGEFLPLAVTVSPLLFKNKPIGAIEVFRDITKDLEIERAKSEFISLASHQLKTPPSAIQWNLDVVLDGTLGSLNDKQRETLLSTRAISEKMVETVNSLLNVSRLELGTFIVDPKPIDYVALAKEVVSEFKQQVLLKDLHVTEDYDQDIPLIPADPGLAKIIIENTFSNAVKYTPTGGNIRISIQKNSSRRPNSLLITVKDSGFGIPKHQQEKIFQKMFRADNVKGTIDGTGFGLYLLKSIVELAYGTVWFESEENKGTTFYIELPYRGMSKKEGTSKLNQVG